MIIINCYYIVVVVAVVAHTSSGVVSRREWGALPAKLVESIDGPVPYVIIHHSYIPPACWTTKACMIAMRAMQSYHQKEHGWNDIGYR